MHTESMHHNLIKVNNVRIKEAPVRLHMLTEYLSHLSPDLSKFVIFTTFINLPPNFEY